jgi:hypothetical protein
LACKAPSARVIAIDGNALTDSCWTRGVSDRPCASTWPADAGGGGKITLIDYFAQEPVTLATLVASGLQAPARSGCVARTAELAAPISQTRRCTS